jgi:ABC-type nitrate/sulfonate/bicarbonate transport system substrate-binding protein
MPRSLDHIDASTDLLKPIAQMILNWGNPPAGVQNAPIYLARAQGVLTLPGIDIVTTDTANGAQHARDLLEGKFHMGHVGAPSLMRALSRTRDYALVGTGLLRHPPHSMLVPADVKKLWDLHGRPVGINRRGTCSHSILRALLAREGMDESQVRVVEMSRRGSLDSMRQDKLVAAVLWEPYATVAMRELGWKIFASGASVWSASRYCTTIYARRSLLDEHRNIVAAMLKSYSRWVRAAQLDLQCAAEQMILEMPTLPAEDIRIAIARDAPSWCSDTSLDRNLLERAIGELQVQSMLPDGFRLDDVITPVSL